ncbi:MAG: hypothetical protein ACXWQJ_11770 [Bdellovibrionota bacterium]
MVNATWVHHCSDSHCYPGGIVPGATVSGTGTAIATAVTTSVATDILTAGTASSGKQNESSNNAADISSHGASNRATMAAAECADGANSELEAKGGGAGSLAACQDDFQKANTLAGMAGKGGGSGELKVDRGVTESQDVQTIFSRFERNFGVNQEDYLTRMLGSHGSLDEFKDILGAKLSAARIDQVLADAVKAEPQAPELTGTEPGEIKVAKKKTDTNLRDSLKNKLALSGKERQLAAEKATEHSSVSQFNEKLQPAELPAWMSESESSKDQDWTIFDVVHAKIQELWSRSRIK